MLNLKVQSRVMNLEYSREDLFNLDLSVTNHELLSIANQHSLGRYIEQKVKLAHKKYAIGGYAENRQVYRRFEHFDNADDKRSVHLGVDFWAPAGTGVLAPLDGHVHSWAFNDNQGDYGGTLILEHHLKDLHFYSLYGHLALVELKTMEAGKKVKAGSQIASLGDYPENGGWPPHLHFQLILDLEGMVGDYPGVVGPGKADWYLKNCPNPEGLF